MQLSLLFYVLDNKIEQKRRFLKYYNDLCKKKIKRKCQSRK